MSSPIGDAERVANERALAQANANINAVLHAARIGAAKGLGKVAMNVHAEITKELSNPGSGKIYRRHGFDHQASAPGEPPAPTTGAYRASWWWKVLPPDPLGAAAAVGTNALIGPFLEYGTRDMAPRPHVRPVVLRTLAQLREELIANIVEEQKKVIAELWARFGSTISFGGGKP